ncbi:MAG: hypothetical protein COA69_03060 [Robiginitomaculum sp.]|nr:MAG: hypothetical protein COA69_03060 [Robiginitomaculum sp.]
MLNIITHHQAPKEKMLSGNPDEAVSFVSKFNVGLPNHIFTIDPKTNKILAKTFEHHENEKLRQYIFDGMGILNFYFLPNRPTDGFKNKKPKKSDIQYATHLYVDVDDPSPETLNKIQSHSPPPSIVIFSGGGYQAFWALNTPCSNFMQIESTNKSIAVRLDGDHCHNVDRIMRIPGTINMPNAKKQASGRIPTLAYEVK